MVTLEYLEALERSIDQVMSLLTQASQDIEQAIMASNNFATEHGQQVQAAHSLHRATQTIQNDLHALLDQRNIVAAEIAQARAEAQQASEPAG